MRIPESLPDPNVDVQAEVALLELLEACKVDPKGYVSEGVLFWYGKPTALEEIAFQQEHAIGDFGS